MSFNNKPSAGREARRNWLRGAGSVGLGTLALGPGIVRAAVYLSEADARAQLWPRAENFNPVTIDLSDMALKNLARSSDTRIPQGYAPRCWLATRGGAPLGWVMLDRALGKYDMIDYAAAFSTTGAVTGMEILAYRESHGGEVRNAAWRKQFSGRTGARQLRFGDDIRNISGATLSCQHVTEGMQRLSELIGLLSAGK